MFIEELYYGNLEPQEYSTELKAELKKKHNELTQIEKDILRKLAFQIAKTTILFFIG